MATDGVKIIDGDLAHDTYWGIMDLYDSGVEIQEIRKAIPFEIDSYGVDDEFSNEIFVTSYALAFWEIGAISSEMLEAVRFAMEKGACVKDWTESYGEKAGKARQRELEKLWNKINRDNTKMRARKKYRKVSRFHFDIDDLLTFKLDDNLYRVVICASIEQYRGNCNYLLIPTTFNSKIRPTPEDLIGYDIAGLTIGSGYDKSATNQMQPGVENLWHLYPAYDYFFFGLVQIAISHKDMAELKQHLEKIGRLKLKDSFKKRGSFGIRSNFRELGEMFKDFDSEMKTFGYKKFPIKQLSEKVD